MRGSAPISSIEQSQMDRQHIYICNGSPAFLDLLRELLASESYNVTSSNFVPRSFEQIDALQPQLLMIDVVLGEQAGWHLLDRLSAGAQTRGIPIIVFSSLPALLDRARNLEAPEANRRFLDKPFDLDALLGLVHDLIGPA